MSATFTSADFAGLVTAKILTQLTDENPNATVPKETTIAQTSATAVDDMFALLGQRKVRPDTMPGAGAFRNAALAVTLYYLYSRSPDLLRGLDGTGDPTKHPIYLRYAKAMSDCRGVARGEADWPELVAKMMDDPGELGTLYGNESPVVFGPPDSSVDGDLV